MKKRVADIVMDILFENSILDCFLVVGGGAMHLNNALALCDNIRKYCMHHEQACAMAADAYARIGGHMAAVCVTSGPGGTNAITGVLGAWQDSLPMLVLSGQVRYDTTVHKAGLALRYRGIQEFDIIPTVKNMTKYAVMLTDPLAIQRELQKSIDIALQGRRGPVWLDIPLDVQSAVVEVDDLYPVEPLQETIPIPEQDELDETLWLLRAAKRPCLLAGNGIVNSNNTQHFRSFAQATGVPVIASSIAGDVCYQEYPLFYGMAGSIGPRPGNFIVQNADVILSMGSPLGYKMTGFAPEHFAPNAKIIMVDIDRNERDKLTFPIHKFIHADLSAFYQKALQMDLSVQVPEDWIHYCNHLRERYSPFEAGEDAKPEDEVSAYRFWKVYQDYEPADSISVLGNNTANTAKLQIGVKNAAQRLVASNNCGSMGADLPETVGAVIASGKEVVCLTGDGSIMMNLQELQTISHYNLPAKIVVFNNNGYGAIRQTCKNFFNGTQIGCTPESGISFPSFEKVAHTFGYPYRLCRSNGELTESLEWLFAQKGRVLLEVIQRYDDPVSPKVMSRLKDDGTFATPALQDMWPFLDEEEYNNLMLW